MSLSMRYIMIDHRIIYSYIWTAMTPMAGNRHRAPEAITSFRKRKLSKLRWMLSSYYYTTSRLYGLQAVWWLSNNEATHLLQSSLELDATRPRSAALNRFRRINHCSQPDTNKRIVCRQAQEKLSFALGSIVSLSTRVSPACLRTCSKKHLPFSLSGSPHLTTTAKPVDLRRLLAGHLLRRRWIASHHRWASTITIYTLIFLLSASICFFVCLVGLRTASKQ